MRVYGGRVAAIDAHLSRLTESARTAGIRILPKKALIQRTRDAVRRSGHMNAIARFSVQKIGTAAPVYFCSVRPFAGCPEAWHRKGIRIRTASVTRTDPRASESRVKGNDYMNAVAAILNAGAVGSFGGSAGERNPAGDPLMLTASGIVCETAVANIFIIRDGVLWTPSAACGILLGVTRRTVIESARSTGLAVREGPFTRHDLFNASEVFLTNAAVEVLPVTEADGRRIADGRPGHWTQKLRALYLDRVTAR